jgi:hypothetical protein
MAFWASRLTMADSIVTSLDLRRAPVVRFFLIVEMANAGDMWGMSVLFRPIDCFSLCFESGEYVIGVIFDHKIIDATTFGATLGSRLNINICHAHISLLGNY